MNDFYPIWRNEKYYFFPDDIRKYPDAWCYVVYGPRASGKTYSALRWSYEEQIKIMYMKRTIKDVNVLCTSANEIDLSPYAPINRDAGYTIRPQLIKEGIGGFYDHVTEDDKIYGAPVSYVSSLNSMKTVKGIELSFCDWLLFDEFIPQAGEIVKHAEGSMLLDMYMTISRDRTKRGREPLKLILFANAEDISTPITAELEIIDDMVDLNASRLAHKYIEDRGIMLHHLSDYEIPTNAEAEGIYKAMKNTAWGRKAFGGEFSNNDFSSIKKQNLKGYQPMAAFYYRNENYYIWRNMERVHICRTRGNTDRFYDLRTDAGKLSFYIDHVIDIKAQTADGTVTYANYSIKYLMDHYKNIMNLHDI